MSKYRDAYRDASGTIIPDSDLPRDNEGNIIPPGSSWAAPVIVTELTTLESIDKTLKSLRMFLVIMMLVVPGVAVFFWSLNHNF